MSHIVLRKWKELQQNVEQGKNNFTTRSIVDLLLNWAKEIQLIKDTQIQNLYEDYLKYFENLNVEDILYVDDNVWYSLKDVIQFDILRPKISTYERAIIHVRDVLFNLLIFKSDKDCPCHGDDNLRVFVEAGSEKLIFECDICLCLVDENNNKQNIGEKLIVPAPASFIRSKNIKPSPI